MEDVGLPWGTRVWGKPLLRRRLRRGAETAPRAGEEVLRHPFRIVEAVAGADPSRNLFQLPVLLRYIAGHGETAETLCLPGVRLGVASLGGAVRRLRRMEHAGRGGRRRSSRRSRPSIICSRGGRAIELIGLDAEVALPERMATGIAELDRAMGGGFVEGSATLIGGDPGIGKSTLLLQAAARIALARAARSPMSRARKRPIRCGCARGGWGWAMRRCSSPRRPRCAIS